MITPGAVQPARLPTLDWSSVHGLLDMVGVGRALARPARITDHLAQSRCLTEVSGCQLPKIKEQGDPSPRPSERDYRLQEHKCGLHRSAIIRQQAALIVLLFLVYVIVLVSACVGFGAAVDTRTPAHYIGNVFTCFRF